MPMPPPKPTTEGPRDQQVSHEIGQLVRALRTEGAQDAEALADLVGARFWETGRFTRALTLAVAGGEIVIASDGRYAAT